MFRYFILFVVLSGLFLSGCDRGGEEEQAASESETDFPRLVKTMVLTAANQGDGLVLPGQLQAAERTELAFQVSGPLIELPVVEGQRVNKGDLLARIDPRDFENQLALRKAQLHQIESQYRRYEKLIQSRNSPISKAQFDRTKSEYEIAKANKAQAEKELDDTFLRAPFDGLIAVKNVENFENVQAKEVILQLQELEKIEIIVDVPEQVAAGAESIPIGEEVGVVTIESVPGKAFPAVLSEVATKADPNTQTYRSTLVMPNPEEITVFPGMTATFVSHLRNRADDTGFRVSIHAVSNPQSKPTVWVVQPESMKVTQRVVKLDESGGEFPGDVLVITEGVEAGERIVVAGTDKLSEGMVVRLYTAGMLSE